MQEETLSYEQALAVLGKSLSDLGVGLVKELRNIFGFEVTDIQDILQPEMLASMTPSQMEQFNNVRTWFEESSSALDEGIHIMAERYDKTYQRVVEDSCNILGLDSDNILAIIEAQNYGAPRNVTVH